MQIDLLSVVALMMTKTNSDKTKEGNVEKKHLVRVQSPILYENLDLEKENWRSIWGPANYAHHLLDFHNQLYFYRENI